MLILKMKVIINGSKFAKKKKLQLQEAQDMILATSISWNPIKKL